MTKSNVREVKKLYASEIIKFTPYSIDSAYGKNLFKSLLRLPVLDLGVLVAALREAAGKVKKK